MLIAAWKAISETIPLARSKSETVSRVERDRHPANDDEDEKKNDEQTEAQTQLLAHDRENEVSVSVGQVGHFLPAVAETETVDSAAPPGDQRLHLLQAGRQLVLLRMEERQEPAIAFRNMGREVKNRADSA